MTKRALLALVTIVAAAAAQPPATDTPVFKPTPSSSLPFAALAVGAGTDPATAALSLASLQAANEITPGENAQTQTTLGTATLVLMGGTPDAPLTELALLQSGDRLGCWTLVNTDLARS